jgi:spermidine/putrescine transport system substrate-binding protein
MVRLCLSDARVRRAGTRRAGGKKGATEVTVFHPREPQRFGRREFLERSALGALGLTVAGPLLAACGGGNGGNGAVELPLARPDNPVTWPIYDDNPPIASGLEPEGGPLRIYNWNGYLWPRIKKDFGKEYGVEVEETYFATTDEAMAKLTSGAVDFDIFFPFQERMGRLVLGKVLQPLNHDYVPNLQKTIWPALRDPFYDKGSQYTVPYTIYTTGIGYRVDKVERTPWDLDNPYEIYWDESNRGKVYVLDDGREAPIHMLLKNGIHDTNTEDPDDIELAKNELESLIPAVNVKYSTDDYTNLPEGRAWVHQMWSGSAVSAQWYLPEGTGPEVLGFWYPPDGRGLIGSDMIAIPKASKNPVLAHHFVNYLLDEKHGYDNFANYVGYQPPFLTLDPDRLVADGVVPANLRTAVVRESDFLQGNQPLELSPEGQKLWQDAWAEFKAGA